MAFDPPKVTLQKREFGTWHLTGFSGVRASFPMDFNGTPDSTHLLPPLRASGAESTPHSLNIKRGFNRLRMC